MKESDLYLPIKQFLQAQNYEVKGEVHDCDVVAVRGDEAPVIVELKRSLNLDVLLQAVARLSLTTKVYIAVPAECSALTARRRHVIKLLRMLGLGLAIVDAAGGVVPEANGVVPPGIAPSWVGRTTKHGRGWLQNVCN